MVSYAGEVIHGEIEKEQYPASIEGVSVEKTVVRETRATDFDYPHISFLHRFEVTDRENQTAEFRYRWAPFTSHQVWIGLLERTDGHLQFEQEDFIPVRIAALGTPELVGYLFAAHKRSYAEISEIVDVSRETVIQYISDIKGGRRKKM